MAYKGVYLEGSSWLARIYADGKQHRIGRYASEEEAARAYDREAQRLHGDAAALNFPGDAVKEHVKAFGTSFVPVPKDWQHLKHHPLACIVEFGAGIDLDQMAAHMRDHGYDEGQPVVLFREQGEWKILDGRHKQAAAIKAGVTPSFKEFTGNGPRAYVEMKAHRQHLNESQRALFFVKLGKLPTNHGADPANLPGHAQTRSQAASAANTSERTVGDARKVDEKGTPELNQAVMDGTLRVSDAAKVADQPPEVQNQAVNAARNGTASTARAAVKNPSANGHKEEAGEKDDTGNKVPERLKEVFGANDPFKKAIAACRRAAKLLKECEQSQAYLNSEDDPGKKDKRLYSTFCLTAARRLESYRPALVCGECGGAEPSADAEACEICGGKGYLFAEEVEASCK